MNGQTLAAAASVGTVRRSAWRLYLIGMVGLTTAYCLAHFVGPRWLNSGFVYNVIGGSAVFALIVGAKMNTRERRLPWYLFAAGQALFVTGDVLAYNYERFFGTALPFPSVADGFYLAFYPLLIVGLVLLINESKESRDRASLIDSVILTVAAGVLAWVYLIAPYAHNSTLDLPTKLTSIAYPLMDILVLGTVLRLAVGSQRREPAFVFLVSGAVALLLSDSIYGWIQLHGGYNTGGLLDAGWAIFYALLGASALHPSMNSLSKRAQTPDARLTRIRLGALLLASLTVPGVWLVRASLRLGLDRYVLAVAAATLFTLVIMRLAGIVRRHEETALRETALRAGSEALVAAGERLVTAGTREEVYVGALEGVQSVIAPDANARIYLSNGDHATLTAVASTEEDVESISPLLLDELPAPTRKLLGRGAVSLDEADGTVCLSPLLFRDQLGGVLYARSNSRPTAAAEESFSTLALEVALALESVALTEAVISSEARLSSLIKNAAEVVCVVGKDAEIHFVSPSVERIFGHAPGGLTGSRFADIVHPADRQVLIAFLATIAARPAGDSLGGEFRLAHQAHGWRDVEVLATNLMHDPAVGGLVLNVRDVSERKAFEAELEHQAFHDQLTGLPNRGLFRDRVEQALAGHRREGRPIAVMFLDIDDFKNVNDSLGHAVGDALLREVARRLEDCMRTVDTAARLGGDEFAVLVESCEREMQPVEIAERVMRELARTIPLEGRDVTIGVSIGIAFSGKGLQTVAGADQLLRNADAAMYMAKQRGKGNYQIFEPEMQAQALTRLELKSDFQKALDDAQFTLRFQPVMDLARNELAGVEALVRWEHPRRGTVAPMDFIPLAEETGLILPLGRYILSEACQQAAILQRQYPRHPPLWISVNVSARQLQNPQFADEVREALAQSQIPPSSLILELTESVMMQDMEVTITRLEALRAMGVRLAIDDFGTGYSSLNYLRRFPVDILKIDRSFLGDPSPQVAELTDAIASLARIFNLESVVEGIETKGHLEFAQNIDCKFGQGFHFAEPLSGEEMLAMATTMAAGQATNGHRSSAATSLP